jgi:thiamine biosynthesis lipoprotein
MHLRVLPVLLGYLWLTGCQPASNESYNEQLFAFGTLIDISFYGVPPDDARQAVQAVDTLFQKQHNDWHAWQRGALDTLNQAIASGRSTETDPSIIQLIRLGQQFETSSNGLFNPAIGHLLGLWGFQQDEPATTVPDPAAIAAWLNDKPSSLQVNIDQKRIHSRNPRVKLDFGGFAKGYSVDKAVALLERRGIHNLIVNTGGDLCLRGRHGDRPWRIGIRSPEGTGILASIDMEGPRCVFTSGDYERYFEADGQRYHHILDPRSGYPARSTRSVTVLSNDATLADAAATALFIAGPQEWASVARKMGVSEVLLIDSQGTAYITPSLARRIHFEEKPPRIQEVEL